MSTVLDLQDDLQHYICLKELQLPNKNVLFMSSARNITPSNTRQNVYIDKLIYFTSPRTGVQMKTWAQFKMIVTGTVSMPYHFRHMQELLCL